MYNGEDVYECQGIGSGWCATTYDYDTDAEYGYCDMATAVLCTTTAQQATLEPTSRTATLKAIVQLTTELTSSTFSTTSASTVTTTPSTTVAQQSADRCAPSVKTIDGEDCVFPFRYDGEDMYECVYEPGGYWTGPAYYWCATTQTYETDGIFGKCDMSTVVPCSERKRRDTVDVDVVDDDAADYVNEIDLPSDWTSGSAHRVDERSRRQRRDSSDRRRQTRDNGDDICVGMMQRA